MNTLETLIAICNSYKEEKYNIEEFQSRLETLIIDEELKMQLEKLRFDVVNRLEQIRFCYLESDFYEKGIEIADFVINKVNFIL